MLVNDTQSSSGHLWGPEQLRSLLPRGYGQVPSEHGGHCSYFEDNFRGKALRPEVASVTHESQDGESAEQLGIRERKKGANGKRKTEKRKNENRFFFFLEINV